MRSVASVDFSSKRLFAFSSKTILVNWSQASSSCSTNIQPYDGRGKRVRWMFSLLNTILPNYHGCACAWAPSWPRYTLIFLVKYIERMFHLGFAKALLNICTACAYWGLTVAQTKQRFRLTEHEVNRAQINQHPYMKASRKNISMRGMLCEVKRPLSSSHDQAQWKMVVVWAEGVELDTAT